MRQLHLRIAAPLRCSGADKTVNSLQDSRFISRCSGTISRRQFGLKNGVERTKQTKKLLLIIQQIMGLNPVAAGVVFCIMTRSVRLPDEFNLDVFINLFVCLFLSSCVNFSCSCLPPPPPILPPPLLNLACFPQRGTNTITSSDVFITLVS